MGIPYRGLGLITLVRTTQDTSLLYAATRGRRVKHTCPTLMHGGSTAHHQAGTTCHIALAVIRRLPLPHNQAMRALLLRRYPLCFVQHRNGSRCTHMYTYMYYYSPLPLNLANKQQATTTTTPRKHVTILFWPLHLPNASGFTLSSPSWSPICGLAKSTF